MKVVVTGAAGFIGNAVATELRSRGHEVIGLDLTADPSQNIYAADFSVPGAGAEYIQGAEVIVHTAALVSLAMTHREAFRVNVAGTAQLISLAEELGVRRFVHLSSIVVYPDTPEVLSEDSPLDVAGTPYVDTKVLSEIPVYHLMTRGQMEAVIIRPGDVYGPRSRPWTWLPYQAMKQKLFALPRWGNGHFTPVYIDDLARGIAAAVEVPEAAGQVFNLTSGEVVTTKEFFGLLARYTGTGKFLLLPTPVAIALSWVSWRLAALRGKRTESNPTTMRYFTRRTEGYSIASAQKILGYQPQVMIREGQQRAAQWCLEQQ